MENDTSFLELSVQGTPFVLKKSLLLDHDWILTKVVDGLIPWQQVHGGAFYIDCDATSFRFILNALRFPDDLCTMSDFSLIDFKLLQRTKDYLMLDDSNLNWALENYVRRKTNRDKLLEELVKKSEDYDYLIEKFKSMEINQKLLSNDLEKKDKLLKEYKKKSECYDQLAKEFQSLKEAGCVQELICKEKRLYRSFNRCNSSLLVIGSAKWENSSLACSFCGPWTYEDGDFPISQVNNYRGDLSEIFENIEY